MRNPQGYALWIGEGKDKEADTITCNHCNRVVVVPPPPAPLNTGFCRMCMDHICGPCADKGSCTPFEKKLEILESGKKLMEALT